MLDTYVLEAVEHGVQMMQPSKGGTHLIRRDQESGEEKEHRAGETTVTEA